MYAATMVHSLGCGLGVLDMLGAALRNEVAERTCLLLDAEDQEKIHLSGDTLKLKGGPSELKNAKSILENRNLIVVQYTTLDD